MREPRCCQGGVPQVEPAGAVERTVGRRSEGSRGGFVLQAVIVAVTLLAVAGVVIVLVRSHRRGQELHSRKALQVCEDGLMRALDSLSRSPSWRAGFGPTARPGGSYEVRLREVADGGRRKLEVTAEGESGGVRRRQQCTLVLSVNGGDSVWIQQGMEEE